MGNRSITSPSSIQMVIPVGARIPRPQSPQQTDHFAEIAAAMRAERSIEDDTEVDPSVYTIELAT
jgi:hypothetical protein